MTLNEAKINVRELEAQVATATEAEDAVYAELKAIQTRLTDARAARFEAEDNLREGRFALRELERVANVEALNALDYVTMDNYWRIANAVKDATRSTKSREWGIAILAVLERQQGSGGMTESDLDLVSLCNGKELTIAQRKRVWKVLEMRCPWRGDKLGTPYPLKLDNDGFIEPAEEVQW